MAVLPESINKGLQKANDEIIGWLNSDDCYEPGTLFIAIEELNKTQGNNIISGDCNVVGEKENSQIFG